MKEFEYTLPSELIADLPEAYKLKPKKETVIETEERTYVSTENLVGNPRIFTLPPTHLIWIEDKVIEVEE